MTAPKRFLPAAATLLIASLLFAPSLSAQTDPVTAAPDDSGDAAQAVTADADLDAVIRSLVHVLDYMAADYAVAVADGEIINEAEYLEMENFARNAADLIDQLDRAGRFTNGGDLRAAAERLATLVAEKADPDTVAAEARAMRDAVIKQTGIVTTPRSWPNLADGAAIYQQQCAQCHGAAGGGDGPAAEGLEPAPTVFSEGERIASISPFQAYNTIRLGVDGTSMLAYSELTDREVWELAFFVKSLKDGGPEAAVPADIPPVDSLAGIIPLDAVAASNDFELAAQLERAGVDRPEAAVAALRTDVPDPGVAASLEIARTFLDRALETYRAGDVTIARQFALRAYLEGVEPVEPALDARDRKFTIALERDLMRVRTEIEDRADIDDVAGAILAAHETVDDAAQVLQAGGGSFWFSFFVAASIMLREGLEAFLIILAILSVLRAAGQKRASRWVHAGWLTALGIGVAGWFLTDLLLQISGAQREIMEGVIALAAVAVLFYVGFWLHSMTEARKWKAFIEDRVLRTLGTGSLVGLFFIAFFAVFREAFESVLFLSALTLEQGDGQQSAVAIGAITALALVIGLAPLALKYSVRIPIRSLFRYSSVVIGILCVVLAGKGIHSLQEAGILPISFTWSWLRVDLLGVYPTVETILAQAIILVALLSFMLLPRLLPRRVSN